MEYSYATRKKLEKTFFKEWESKKADKINGLPSKEKIYYEELMGNLHPNIASVLADNNGAGSLAKVIQEHFSSIVKIFVSQEDLEDYYYIIDKFVQFQYTTGYERRSLRTKDISAHFYHALQLLFSFRALAFYDVSISDFIRGNLSEEKRDMLHNVYYSSKLNVKHLDDMIASKIDHNDQEIIETIREALLSENNTVIVTSDIIRGILKSDSDELQDLLVKFLIAARLQEGVRQVICENADCGTTKGCLKIIDAIKQENLLRFAAVKRAVATWTGICSYEHLDRITDKVFEDIFLAIRDTNEARKLIQTNDSIHIMIGLWSLGFYEVEDAIDAMREIAENGSRNQILTISYYNRSIQNRKLAGRIALRIFEQYQDDHEMVAAFMCTYLEGGARCVDQGASIMSLLETEAKAREHYGILKSIYGSMKKKKEEFSPSIFPWYSVTLHKGFLVSKMCDIAYSLKDHSLIDEVCELLSDIDGGRSRYVALMLYDPQTSKQRKAIINYVADKERFSRNEAFTIVSKMDLTDDEYMQLETFLRFKSQDIRKSVLDLLKKRPKEQLKESISRLLASSDTQMRLGGLDMLKEQYESDKAHQAEWVSLASNINNPELFITLIRDALTLYFSRHCHITI